MNTSPRPADLTVTDADIDRDPANLAGPAGDLVVTDTGSAVTDRTSAVRQGDLPTTDIGSAITDSVAPVTDSAALVPAPGHDAAESVAPVTDIRQPSLLGDIAGTPGNIAVTDTASVVTDTPNPSRQQTTPSRTSGTASLETTVTRIEQEGRHPMNQEHLKKWTPEALNTDAPPEKLRLPFHVLAGEAIDVARFCQRNWEPFMDRDGVQVRPGLKSAVGNGTFSATMVEDLLELHDAFQTAQTKYQLMVTGSGASLMGTAQALVDDIRSTLEWYFDDGKEDAADAQLAALVTTHANALSHDAMAAALFDFAELADLHRAAVHGLGGFRATMIDEARALARTLRERSAGSAGVDAMKSETDAYTLRNRIGALLFDRMSRARAAAKFVFRKHSELVREATSAYERRARAARRNRDNEEEETPEATPPSPPVATSPSPAAIPAATSPNVGPTTSATAD